MPGVPETEEFPFDVWTRLHSRFWRHPSATLLRLGAPAGLQALRQAIARYLATFRGLTCDWRQVIVTPGAQPALDLMIQRPEARGLGNACVRTCKHRWMTY